MPNLKLRNVPMLSLCILLTPPAVATANVVSLDVISTGYETGANAASDSTVNAQSYHGVYGVFDSGATNQMRSPPDANGGQGDVFIRNLATHATVRASVDSSGHQQSGNSDHGSITPNGRYVVFRSDAHLAPLDMNAKGDIYWRDMQAGITSLVSVGYQNQPTNDYSELPSISETGRYVAFLSAASNLVAVDANQHEDVFLRDMTAGVTELVSLNSLGQQGNDWSSQPRVSRDGRDIAFVSAATNLVPGASNGAIHIYLRDRVLNGGDTSLISSDANGVPGNSSSGSPALSADVRYVAFVSWATNLVPGFVTNGKLQVYLKDRVTGQIVAVSAVNNNMMGGNEDSLSATISANGRYVAWSSRADNLVPGDNNASSDVFVRDMQTGVLTRVSVDKFGTQGNDASGSPSISPDGCRVEFGSNATNWILDSGLYDNFGGDSVFAASLPCATNTLGP